MKKLVILKLMLVLTMKVFGQTSFTGVTLNGTLDGSELISLQPPSINQSDVQRIRVDNRQLLFEFNTLAKYQSNALSSDGDNWGLAFDLVIEAEDASNVLLNRYFIEFKLDSEHPLQQAIVDYSDLEGVDHFKLIKQNYTPVSGNLTDQIINENVQLIANFNDQLTYGITTNGISKINPVSLKVVECSGCTADPGRVIDGVHEIRKVDFEWSLPDNDMFFPSYDLEVFKVEPDENQKVVIDWTKASTLEVNDTDPTDNNTVYTMVLSEGTGYYVWRVRPIGNFYPGGRTNVKNYGEWSVHLSTGDIDDKYDYTDIDNPIPQNSGEILNEERSIESNVFYFVQFDEFTNWIYGKVLTEGSRQSETMTFANGLNQIQQTQTHLFSDKSVVATQTVQDFSGRPSLQTLPAPIARDRLGYKKDFFTTNTGEGYHAEDYDENGKIFGDEPTPLNDTTQISSIGTVNQYYSNSNSGFNVLGKYGEYVPTAQGIPYARTQYYTDATGRVKKQAGPSKTHRLEQNETVGHNIITMYGAVSQDELDVVFGSEAPLDSTVYKVVTTDPNKINSVSYIGKAGQVVATCLSDANATPNLEDIGNEQTTTVTTTFDNSTLVNGDMKSVSRKTLIVDVTSRVINLNYEITPKTFDLTCAAEVCSTCDYRVEIEIINSEEPDVRGKNILIPFSVTPEQLNACLDGSALVFGQNLPFNVADIIEPMSPSGPSLADGLPGSITLPFGTYIVEKRVYVGNKASDGELFIDKRLEELRVDRESWTAQSNCCGPFTSDLTTWSCGDEYCDKVDPTLFATGDIDGLDLFIDQLVNVVSKERESGYLASMSGTGAGLLSNQFNDKASLTDFMNIVISEPNTSCVDLATCLSTAELRIDGNTQIVNSSIGTSPTSGFNSSGVPTTDNAPAGISYDEELDVLHFFLQCAELEYGLTARYFDHNNNPSSPLDGELFLKRIDPVLDIIWGSNAVNFTGTEETWSVVWTGFIETPIDGGTTYDFEADVDDGVVLIIDNQSVINQFGANAGVKTGSVTLQPGQRYPIRIEMRENTGGAQMVLKWNHAGISGFDIIPFNVFSPECGGMTSTSFYSSTTANPNLSDPTTFYVQVADGTPGNNIELVNATCIGSYFNSDLESLNLTNVYSLPQSDLITGLAENLEEATQGICSCVNDQAEQGVLNPNLPDATQLSADATIECQLNCEKRSTEFEESIDAFVLNENAKVGVFTESDPNWNTTTNFLGFDLNEKLCYSNAMVNQCKEQCALPLTNSIIEANLSDPTDYPSPTLPGVIYDDYASYIASAEFQDGVKQELQLYQEAINYNAKFAPYKPSGNNYTNVDIQEQQSIENDIVNFINNALSDGLINRIKTHTTGDPGNPSTLNCYEQGSAVPPPSGLAANHQSIIFPYPYFDESSQQNENKELEVVVNTIWNEGTQPNDKNDDLIFEYNVQFFCGGAAIRFYAEFGSGHGCTNVGGVGDENNIVNISSEILDVNFDAAGQIHMLPMKSGCMSFTTGINNDIMATASIDVASGGAQGNQSLIEIIGENGSIEITDGNVLWQNDAATTAQAIVDAINNKVSNPDVTAILSGTTIELTVLSHPSINIFEYDIDITGSIPISNIDGFNTTSNEPLGTSLENRISCGSSYNSECPYGYFNIGEEPAIADENSHFSNLAFRFNNDILEQAQDFISSTLNGPDGSFNSNILFNVDHVKYEFETVIIMDQGLLKSLGFVLDRTCNPTSNHFFTIANTGSGDLFNGRLVLSDPNDSRQVLSLTLNPANYRFEIKSLVGGENINSIGKNSVTGFDIFKFNGDTTSGCVGEHFWHNSYSAISCFEDCPMCLQWESPIQQFNSGDLSNKELVVNTCESLRANYIEDQEDFFFDNCLKTKEEELLTNYENGCLKNIDDKLTLTYDLGYHHYTLYYYDRAGNLTQTVPPEGVQQLDGTELVAVKAARTNENNPKVYPNHRLETNYNYNSIQQLVTQVTPDGGETKFWYNANTQLVLSQDADQAVALDNGVPSPKYSYTRYDRLGRIIETGVIQGFNPSFRSGTDNQIIEEVWLSSEFPGNVSGLKYFEVHKTTYTANDNESLNGRPQRNTRNRISKVERDVYGDATLVLSTIYSYDEHGNVEWLIHDLPDIGRKSVLYDYDLISGNVNTVTFNENTSEQFIHRYTYDEDNRIIDVFTSTDKITWTHEANYDYYFHGPLARTEIGHDDIQGCDYAYTIEGYMKSMNQVELTPTKDIGKDGVNIDGFLADEFAMELDYYQGDYKRSGSELGIESGFDPYSAAVMTDTDNSLFNGNISAWKTNTRSGNTDPNNEFEEYGIKMNVYRYDKLNRIKEADFHNYDGVSWINPSGNVYDESFTYDANGNILELTRYGFDNGTSILMDDMRYAYQTDDQTAQGSLVSNRLYHVQDLKVNSGYGDDISINTAASYSTDMNQGNNNYQYDAEGNLVRDIAEGIEIDWNELNKVEEVRRTDNGVVSTIKYEYDAMGNRVLKRFFTDGVEEKATYYVNDASGNVMGVYRRFLEVSGTPTTGTPTTNCYTQVTMTSPVDCNSGCTQTIQAGGENLNNVSVNSGEQICIPSGLNYQGSVNMNGGVLVICGDIASGQNFTINGSNGTIYVLGSTRVGNLSLNGGLVIENYGSTEISNALTINNGTFNNYGTLTATVIQNNSTNAYFENYGNVTVASAYQQNAGTITNHGSITLATSLNINNGTTVNNGDFNVGTDLQVQGASNLTNNCTMNVNANVVLNQPFTNAGVLTIQGTLTQNGGGVMTLAGGSEINSTNVIFSENIFGDAITCSSIKISGNTTINGSSNISGKVDICDANGIENLDGIIGTEVTTDCSCTFDDGGVVMTESGLFLDELNIYGSERIGQFQPHWKLNEENPLVNLQGNENVPNQHSNESNLSKWLLGSTGGLQLLDFTGTGINVTGSLMDENAQYSHPAIVLDENNKLLLAAFADENGDWKIVDRSLNEIEFPSGVNTSANTEVNAEPIFLQDPLNGNNFYFVYQNTGDFSPIYYVLVDVNNSVITSSGANQIGALDFGNSMEGVELKNGNGRLFITRKVSSNMEVYSVDLTSTGFNPPILQATVTGVNANVQASSDLSISPAGDRITLSLFTGNNQVGTTQKDIVTWDVDLSSGMFTNEKAIDVIDDQLIGGNMYDGNVAHVTHSPASEYIYYTIDHGSGIASGLGRVNVNEEPIIPVGSGASTPVGGFSPNVKINGGFTYQQGVRGLSFNAEQDLTINEVKVYAKWEGSGSQVVSVELMQCDNCAGVPTFINSKTFNLNSPCVWSGGTPLCPLEEYLTLNLDFVVPQGNGYYLRRGNSTTLATHYDLSGGTYPYGVTGTIQITKPVQENGQDMWSGAQNHYPYFYDWVVTPGSGPTNTDPIIDNTPLTLINGSSGSVDITHTLAGSLLLQTNGTSLQEVSEPDNSNDNSIVVSINSNVATLNSTSYKGGFPNQRLDLKVKQSKIKRSDLTSWVIGTLGAGQGEKNVLSFTGVDNSLMNEQDCQFNTSLGVSKDVAVAENAEGKRELIFMTANSIENTSQTTDLFEQNGLKAQYFSDQNFTTSVGTQLDQDIDFDFGSGGPAILSPQTDNFSIRWSGQVDIPQVGQYTFITESDFGKVRLLINGVEQFNVGITNNNLNVEQASINLPLGRADIVLEYFEGTGDALVRLKWVGPGIPEQVIPTANLFGAVNTTLSGDIPILLSGDGSTLIDPNHNIISSQATKSIFIKQPGDNDLYYLITGKDEKLYSHLINAKLGTIVNSNIELPLVQGGTLGYSTRPINLDEYSLAVYNDLTVENRNKLYVAINDDDERIGLYEFAVTEQGLQPGVNIHNYEDEVCSQTGENVTCQAVPQADHKISVGEMHISPEGDELAFSYSSGATIVNEHPYIVQDANGDITWTLTIDASDVPTTALQVIGTNNGGQAVLMNILNSEVDNGDGTFTYSTTSAATSFLAGDDLKVKFDLISDGGAGHLYIPGPNAGDESSSYIYSGNVSSKLAFFSLSGGSSLIAKEKKVVQVSFEDRSPVSSGFGNGIGGHLFYRNISTFDYSPSADYIYYNQRSCNGTSPQCTSSDYKRIRLSDDLVSGVQLGVTEIGVGDPLVEIRRGKDGKMYINRRVPPIGLSSLLTTYSNPNAPMTSSIGIGTYQTEANVNYGLPLQPYCVYPNLAKEELLISKREVGKRTYESKDHLGNVRVALSDRRNTEWGNMAEWTEDFETVSYRDATYARTGNYSGKVFGGPGDPTSGQFVFFDEQIPENATDLNFEGYVYFEQPVPNLSLVAHCLKINEQGGIQTIEFLDLDATQANTPNTWHQISFSMTGTQLDNVDKFYVLAYIPNQSEPIDIWFDDFKVNVTSSKDFIVKAETDVKAWQDYYAFGSIMPGRVKPKNDVESGGYRYGFQGQEQDDEWKGRGNQVNYEYRSYDARLGRWMSLDPAAQEYPSLSDYAFVGNTPIQAVDPDGTKIRYLMAVSYSENRREKIILVKASKEIKRAYKDFFRYLKRGNSDFRKQYNYIKKSNTRNLNLVDLGNLEPMDNLDKVGKGERRRLKYRTQNSGKDKTWYLQSQMILDGNISGKNAQVVTQSKIDNEYKKHALGETNFKFGESDGIGTDSYLLFNIVQKTKDGTLYDLNYVPDLGLRGGVGQMYHEMGHVIRNMFGSNAKSNPSDKVDIVAETDALLYQNMNTKRRARKMKKDQFKRRLNY